MKKILYFLLSAALIAGVIMPGCSGSGSTSTGSVALYATDDISAYQQVNATLKKVRFTHTGSGSACDVLTAEQTTDLTELASLFELLAAAECPAQSYNRLHLEFDQSVTLADSVGTTSACSFNSYKDENNNPNVLICSGGNCSLDITGAVNVLASQTNETALDFDLKNFDVTDFGLPTCSATMKVSPLNASGMQAKGYNKSVVGSISGLDTAAKTFTLTRGTTVFSANYPAVNQAGIGSVLTLAQSDGLKVRAVGSIDSTTNTITASSLYALKEGTVSNLDTGNKTFSFTYSLTQGGFKTITVSYLNAASIEGALSDTARVEVQLSTFDGSAYGAYKIRVI